MTVENDHAAVGLELLAANTNIPHVFDGRVDNNTPPPYVLVYTRVEYPRDAEGTALDAVQKTVRTTLTCHCVGLDATAARAMAGQARLSLLNVRPTIAGRNCSPIKQVESLDPERDESTGRLVMDMVVVFDFLSTT